MKRILIVVLLFVALLVPANTAKAEGFAITDFSARGVGLAGGMVGRADDPSAIAYNPAGITQLPGFQFMVGGSVLSPTGTITARNNATGEERTTTTVDNLYPAPHVYATYQVTDFLWLGLGVFPRFGLGIEYPNDWFGQYNLTEVSLETITVNPTIAFKVTDKMSFAFGMDIMTASMDMDKNTDLGRASNRQNLKGDGTAFGFNAALHYVFNEQWRAGLTYRHHVNARVDGDSKWDQQQGFMVDSPLHGTLKLPGIISFGLNYAPTPIWDFEVGFVYTEVGFVYTMWSAYEDLNIYLDAPSNFSMLSPKEWKDTWLFNISTEYQALDWLALRLGYSYETTPLDDRYVDYMMPSEGRHRFSTGLGFIWDNWVLDVAYSYILVREVDYADSIVSGVGPGGLGQQTFEAVRGFDGETHVGAISLSYKF